jgi:hypothetical protein
MIHTTSESVRLAFAPTLTLPLVLVVASDVGEEICRPATQLLVGDVDSRGDWCLLGQFSQLMEHVPISGGKDLLGFWYKHHVSFHVAGGFVMLAVGDLP